MPSSLSHYDLSHAISRRDFLKAAGIGVTAGLLETRGALWAAEAQPRKPNIVFIFPDQMRHFSWTGGGDMQVKTPNLENFAHEGVSFNHCLTNHPLCSPYRASLLTGRYQQAHGVANNVEGGQGGLSTSEVSIATLLKTAGYATGYVGKWHLYPDSEEGRFVPPGPHRHGFDHWRAAFNYRKRYETKYYDDNGRPVLLPDYAPKCQMDQVLEFIEKNASKPFCVFCSWHPPHEPYKEAPQRFVDLYPAEKIQLRANVPKNISGTARHNHVGYFAHISAEDAEMGRLMAKLSQLGIADNTIVCFSSDHGDMLGSFGRYGKNVPWEESIRVPFLIRCPSLIPAGRRLDTLFSSVDIAPTLLSLAGVSVPSNMQGTDLSDVLRGKDEPGPHSVFIMSGPVGKKEGRGEGGAWRGVRTVRYTYAQKGKDPWLFYDNEKDPCQQRNLIEDPAYEQPRKELQADLAAWKKRVGEA